MSKYTYEQLLAIIEQLRGENGCPWDKKQTHESLVPCMIEESYEAIEAIKNNDMENLREELGDVLLQVVLHAQIAKEKGAFTMEDIVDDLTKKMVYRHPHVFKDTLVEGEEDVLNNWEALKKKEKKYDMEYESMMNVPKSLPAIIRAQKVIKKGAKVGFIWEDYKGVVEKVKEELGEVEEAILTEDKEEIALEIGDLLFSTIGLAEILQINGEFALTKSLEKFINRFRYIEKTAFLRNKSISEMTLSEMDELWNEYKKTE